jgi:hypothetical protein
MRFQPAYLLRLIVLAALTIPLLYATHPVEAQSPPQQTNCTVTVKVNDFTVLADMGDGLFSNQMEVQLVLSVGHDQFIIDRYFPAEGNESMSRGDTRQLENFIFSVPAREEIRIEILALEIDQLPGVFGVDVGMVFVGVSSFFENLGGLGNVVGGVLRSGVDLLRDSFADDSIITDDIITLYADEWWNAGENVTYRTADDGLELSYRVGVSGCSPIEGA